MPVSDARGVTPLATASGQGTKGVPEDAKDNKNGVAPLPETQLILLGGNPSVGASPSGTLDVKSSLLLKEPGNLPLEPGDGGDMSTANGSSGSLSFDEELEEARLAASKSVSSKPTFLSKTLGAITSLVDDYKTMKASYGPPYHAEYGGDLLADCNKMAADLIEIDQLLKNGANPNIGPKEEYGFTPIHCAARFGNLELLKMLKRAGGNLDITNALGFTPLSYCCAFKLSVSPKGGGNFENMQVSVIKWLLEQKANPNHVDKTGYTPLAWVCRSGVFPGVVALVEAGADIMQRRPTLPGGSQVRLCKADPLAVTSDKKTERYLQAKINAILQRDETLLRRDVREDRRKERLKAVHDAITKRKEARQFVIQEKERVKAQEELSLELGNIDKSEEARKGRREWLRRLKVSPGIWVKIEPNVEGSTNTREGGRSPASPGLRGRRPRPKWVFDRRVVFSTKDAAAHDVLEQARQVEAFILNGDITQKVLGPRWRAMTGKRLMRLEHGKKPMGRSKGQRRNNRGGVGGGELGGDCATAVLLSGLEEEGSESSRSSSSESG